MEKEALFASIKTYMLTDAYFVWSKITAFYRCLRKQMDEEAVLDGFCQLLTIPSNVLFMKET